MHDASVLMVIVGWIVFGGFVGLVARGFFPGGQSISWPVTIGLGLAGSLIGGMFANFFIGGGQLFVMQTSGWIGSFVGAVAALALLVFVKQRRLAR